jgi:hypothetical protein
VKGFCLRAGLCLLVVGLLVLVFGVACATMPARPDDVLWSKTLGENGSYNCLSIARTVDGGYVLGGLSAGGNDTAAYAAKTDGNGSLLWANRSVPGSITFNDVVSLPDGSFVFAGACGGNSTNAAQQGLLVKTDREGRQVFARTYSLDYNCAFSQVVSDDDGSLVALSYVSNLSSSGPGGSFVYLQKTDAGGNVLWSKLYGDINCRLTCNRLVKAPDGGYVIAGSIFTIDRPYSDAYLLRVDAAGNKLWDARYNGSGYIDIFALCTADDDGYLLAGQISNPPTTNLYLLRVASNGTSLWNRICAVTTAAQDVTRASDGGFVLACGQNITKVYSDGAMDWERGFGTGNYSLNCVVEAADDSYVFGGYTETSGGDAALWLVDIGNTRGPGITPEACCWPALVLPAVAISVVALRRRRQG